MNKQSKMQDANSQPQSSYEELKHQFAALLHESKIDEALRLLEYIPNKEETDYYFRWKAIFTVVQDDRSSDKAKYYKALDSISHALMLSNSEQNLVVKKYVLEQALQDIERIERIELEYSFNYDTFEILQIDRHNEPLNLDIREFRPSYMDEPEIIFNEEKKNQVIDELISRFPKATYYRMRALGYISKIPRYGVCSVSDENYQKAIYNIEKAIEMEPDYPLYCMKADLEVKALMIDEAVITYEKAYQYHQDKEKHLMSLIKMYSTTKQPAKSLSVIEELLSNDGENIRFLEIKYLLCYELKQFQKAWDVLEAMIAINRPNDWKPSDLAGAISGNDLDHLLYSIEKDFFKISRSRKLILLLELEDYDGYARLICEFIDKGIDISLTEDLFELISRDQHLVFVRYFNDKSDISPVIMWFLIGCYAELGDNDAAANLIRIMDYEKLFNSIKPPSYPSSELFCRALKPSKMSSLLFLELIINLALPFQTAHSHCFPRYYDSSIFDTLIRMDICELSRIVKPVREYNSEAESLLNSEKVIDDKLRILQSIDKSYIDTSSVKEFLALIERSLAKSKDELFQQKIHKAKVDERNRILSNLSHSIKNILKSVIDPLMALRDEFPENKATINNAIKGANLIREMVNSVNLSYKATLEDLVWDIKHPGTDAISLQTMIWDSIRYSVSNMFDFRYFPVYAENYFPISISKAEYQEIEEEWDAVTASDNMDDLFNFIEKYMCHLKLNIDESVHYQIGNEKSSAIKLMILFQEIIFNAVKYCSFIPRATRFIDVSLRAKGDKLHLEVINSFDPQIRAKTTGVGKVVIENFSKILDTDPKVHRTNDTYQVSLKFKNLWRKNAESTLH